MPRCELSGKGPVVKNLVSHSNIKTKSRALPNIQRKQVYSQALNEQISLKVATSTIRNIEHCGGLDSYILKQDDKNLSKRALKVKLRVQKKLNLK
ncbi:MAG: 50S ribosomal protein L28 [Bdellovibrionaceae bacterium]|jgi:large subunit ribosomal protein L28|nr:50S ribosomal protein L28 [Pseudobdellovibrionaceae bacterium]